VDTVKHIQTPSPLRANTLARAVGTAGAPLFIDVRKAEDFAASEHIIPGMLRWDFNAGALPPAALEGARNVVVYCVKGAHVGITGAEKIRAMGIDATYLEGGLRGWIADGAPTAKKRPDLGVTGDTPSKWVTRERPKIDRIACPWLVRRFIDPSAEFFYVPTNEVFAFAKANNAVAYDIPGAPLEHDGAQCSFDSFLQAFELKSAALDRLATIVRGADTDALQLAPQSAGLLAISLGLSRNIKDDHHMLDAAMPIYDALYSWAQTVVANDEEKHNWKPA
jgi:rhodanese-related sulfurtransferase